MAHFDDNWLTILRTAMADHASTLPGVALQFADAQGDVARQLSQIQNFVAQDAAAIIVNAADTTATPSMTKIAQQAGVPADASIVGPTRRRCRTGWCLWDPTTSRPARSRWRRSRG
jgi:hypothetical protein